MKRVCVFLVCVMVLVASLACGGGGGGAGVECPGGLEPHRASAEFHGWTFDLPPDVECLGDTDVCVNAVNHDETATEMCGEWYTGVPGHRHGLCTASGRVELLWGGDSATTVCVAYYED